MRVVADANVLVSAALSRSPQAPSALTLDAALDELAGRDDVDVELAGVDREQVEIAGDECVRAAGSGEREEGFVAGIATHRWVRSWWVDCQSGLGGEIGDETNCLLGGEILA